MYGAITGSIAWSYYRAQNLERPTKKMEDHRRQAMEYLPGDLAAFVDDFSKRCGLRAASYDRIGIVQGIPV